RVLHEAFYIANSGRPGPVLVDIPKDVQFALGTYYGPQEIEPTRDKSYHPQREGDARLIEAAVDMMLRAERPILYTGGGVVNSGPEERLHHGAPAELSAFSV